MRDYGKVFTTFWSSATVRGMSEDARSLALYLMTCPHGTIAGVFRLPDGYVCEDLQWTKERVSQGFAELFDKGFAYRCEATKWVCIAKFFQWNQPENPNQRKSVAKVVAQVPASCIWLNDFYVENAHHWGGELTGVSNPSVTLHKPFPNQEQEQEQEVNTSCAPKPSFAANEPTGDNCPHQQIVGLYHQHLPSAIRVREWTPARAQALRARWREKPQRQNLEWWERFFGYIAESDFLMGRAHSNGRKPFEIDLEWICQSKNFVKIIEGKFHEAKEVAA